MISQRFALLALSIAASFLTTASAAVLESDKLQEPPMQRADWTPPKCDVPADVVAATAKLFQQGLADPRGCEYREIGVRAGDRESGDAGVLACHGWVLPDAGKGAQRFAVCWNGLVYPVEWIGGKATVGTDVEISIERDDGWETFVEQSACSRESGRST